MDGSFAPILCGGCRQRGRQVVLNDSFGRLYFFVDSSWETFTHILMEGMVDKVFEEERKNDRV